MPTPTSFTCARGANDPATGQFLTRDPLEDLSGEPYLYAGGDPIGNTDPLGLLFGVDLEDVSNAAAGFGDGATGLISGAVNTASFGYVDLPTTYDIREAMGTNGAVDFCSGLYGAGQFGGESAVLGIVGGGPALKGIKAAWGKGRDAWKAGRGGKHLITSRKTVPTGGKKWRISPTGHRPNPNSAKPEHWGRNLPHYHRRLGIKHHRPWEKGL